MKLWLKILLAVVCLAAVGSAAAYWFVCPCVIVPGGPVRGELVEAAVGDWSFVNDREAVPLCQIEVDFPIPRSMNVNCFSVAGSLHVSCSRCEGKQWSARALAHPDGFVKAGERIYPITYERVVDAAALDTAWRARAAKVGGEGARAGSLVELPVELAPTGSIEEFRMRDVVVIGAGMSGMYQVYRLRELGFDVQGFEAGSNVGGTWYWNRYPGARFDSESYSYGYSFSKEVLDEWDWSEHFSPQPETLRYCNFVADKFDLRRHFRFGMRLAAAHWDEGATAWELTFENGETERCRFLVTGIGALSAPVMPALPGFENFEGEVHHTGLWPQEPVAIEGRRVGVVGTGATGVQVIQEVAKTADHLTVFQRTPNWCAPLNNRPITPEEQAEIKAGYEEIFALCNSTTNAFMHDADPRKTLEVAPEDREALWEKLYAEPGFGIWLANFGDIFVSREANDLVSAFVAGKIRERVDDPAVAEKLIPKNHGFGTRRVPMETNYYEVYNQPNVDLVDLAETPIKRVTQRGVVTADGEIGLDLLILATGFDAVRGAFDRIDIRGAAGKRLKDHWDPGPKTYLGLAAAGFPNLLTLVGPHNSATFCNIPRCIEQNVDWVTGTLVHMRERGLTRIDATPEAEREWTQHVQEVAEPLLLTKTRSWFLGLNTNLEGRDKPQLLVYCGGAPRYRERCDEVTAEGYAGFLLS